MKKRRELIDNNSTNTEHIYKEIFLEVVENDEFRRGDEYAVLEVSCAHLDHGAYKI